MIHDAKQRPGYSGTRPFRRCQDDTWHIEAAWPHRRGSRSGSIASSVAVTWMVNDTHGHNVRTRRSIRIMMRMSRAPPPPPRAQWYLCSCVDGVINININININVRDVHQASGIRHQASRGDTGYVGWPGLGGCLDARDPVLEWI